MPPLEFVITRVVHCTKDIFSRQHVSYWPFVWMVKTHGRTLSNRTFGLHERFCIIFNEKHSFCRYFFYRDRSVSIKTRNLRIFACEIFKETKEIDPIVFSNILISLHNFIISLVFSWTQVTSVFNETETIAFLGPKIWNSVLLVINPKNYVSIF